jgi:hypothetical protein
MMTSLILIAVIVIWAYGELRLLLAEERWEKERGKLLNRVQAGTLRDYAVFAPKQAAEAPPEPVVTETPPVPYTPGLTSEALISARSAYRELT